MAEKGNQRPLGRKQRVGHVRIGCRMAYLSTQKHLYEKEGGRDRRFRPITSDGYLGSPRRGELQIRDAPPNLMGEGRKGEKNVRRGPQGW